MAKITAKKAPALPATRSELNPIRILVEEHREIRNLFHQFEKTRDIGEQEKIAELIFWRLETHARLEDSALYPEIEKSLDAEGEELVRESRKEHAHMSEIIEELRELPIEDRKTRTRILELKESSEHHFSEEESETFASAEKILAGRIEKIGSKLQRLKRKFFQERASRRFES